MKWPTITVFPQPYDARATILVTQWLFVLTLGVATTVIAIVDLSALMSASALVSVLLLAAGTALVMAPRVVLTPHHGLFYLVPVVDAAAVAALRLENPHATTGALLALVIPAAWLGTSGRIVTVPLAGALAIVAVAPDIATLASPDVSLAAGPLSLIVMVPIAMMLAALFAFTLVDEAETASTAEREARQLRDAIVETVDAGILVINGHGEILLVNRVVREHPVVAGLTRIDAENLRTVPAFHADGVTPYPLGDGPIKRAMASDDNTEVLFWLRQPDGTPHAFTASSTRLRNAAGRVVATVIALSDVTQFLAAVQARDRLISTVSHELRTPLTAMKGFLELAREELPNDAGATAAHLAVVERNLEREHAIIEQFILAANSFEGRLQIRPVDLDIAAVARDVVAASSLVRMRGDVAVHVMGESVACRADLSLVSTVIDALLSNALGATTAGGKVSLTVRTVDSGRVRLEVADDGIGISDVDNRQLFEPFFRTERAHLEAVPGVGLGLPLVKQIVDAHGGTVEITSELGVGTTVVIELPAS